LAYYVQIFTYYAFEQGSKKSPIMLNIMPIIISIMPQLNYKYRMAQNFDGGKYWRI